MLKLLKYGLFGVLLVLVVVIVAGLFMPRDWNVSVTVGVPAPVSAIHPLVNDFHRWKEWIAWDPASDPTYVLEISGAAEGVGAIYAWRGESTGRGRLEIVKSDPNEGVWLDEAIESDEVNAHGSITYRVDGETTYVTWSDQGLLPPVIGGYFRPMVQKGLEEHFHAGLVKLASVASAAKTHEAVESK